MWASKIVCFICDTHVRCKLLSWLGLTGSHVALSRLGAQQQTERRRWDHNNNNTTSESGDEIRVASHISETHQKYISPRRVKIIALLSSQSDKCYEKLSNRDSNTALRVLNPLGASTVCF